MKVGLLLGLGLLHTKMQQKYNNAFIYFSKEVVYLGSLEKKRSLPVQHFSKMQNTYQHISLLLLK